MNECTGGDGACSARALAHIGLCSKDQRATIQRLDSEIKPLHDRFCREKGNNVDISEAGIPGEQWHTAAISNACKGEGFHFIKVQIDPEKRSSLKSILEDGSSYFVIGVTNNQWFKGPKKQQLKYPSFSAMAPYEDPNDWMHSIAVVDGKVLDANNTVPISSLWIKANNQPDPKKGYMRSIRKVYRVHKCKCQPLDKGTPAFPRSRGNVCKNGACMKL